MRAFPDGDLRGPDLWVGPRPEPQSSHRFLLFAHENRIRRPPDRILEFESPILHSVKPKEHTWPQYIRNGLGFRLSCVGERLGFGGLPYKPVIMELFHTIAPQNAAKVSSAIREVFPDVRSVIDVGCGSGAFAAEFTRHGVCALGLEHSRHRVALARRQGVDCRRFDVAKHVATQICETANLVYSFEVAKHVSAR